jgi:hypothetical protein
MEIDGRLRLPYTEGMLKRSRNPRPTDPNELAASIVREAVETPPQTPSEIRPEKNPAAVSLGRLGGLKGGLARAKALSKAKRKAIAKKAAAARWRKTNEEK